MQSGKNMTRQKPPTPGEILLNDYLIPNAITQKDLAAHLGWTQARLNEIIKNKRAITADSALSLAQAFDTCATFWLDLQRDLDLYLAQKKHTKVKKLHTARTG